MDEIRALIEAYLEEDEHIDNKQRNTVRLKGGKGSGHHGHSGRPGMVGGSTSGRSGAYDDLVPAVVKELKSFEDEHTRLDRLYNVEQAVVLSPDGDVLTKATGEMTTVNVPQTSRDADAIITHNHPPTVATSKFKSTIITPGKQTDISQPPSISDIVIAANRNYAQMRVVGYDKGKRVVYVVDRPKSGWPDARKLAGYAHQRCEWWRNNATYDMIGNVDHFSKSILTKVWEDASKEFGIGFYHGEL